VPATGVVVQQRLGGSAASDHCLEVEVVAGGTPMT